MELISAENCFVKECIKETRKRKIEVGDDEVREFCLWNLYFLHQFAFFTRACIFSPHMATTKQLKKWPGDIADAKHRYLSNTNATSTAAGTTSSRICKMLPPKRRWVSESRKDKVRWVIQVPCTYSHLPGRTRTSSSLCNKPHINSQGRELCHVIMT